MVTVIATHQICCRNVVNVIHDHKKFTVFCISHELIVKTYISCRINFWCDRSSRAIYGWTYWTLPLMTWICVTALPRLFAGCMYGTQPFFWWRIFLQYWCVLSKKLVSIVTTPPDLYVDQIYWIQALLTWSCHRRKAPPVPTFSTTLLCIKVMLLHRSLVNFLWWSSVHVNLVSTVPVS